MKIAQKGIPEWLLELYDPLDEIMTKRTNPTAEPMMAQNANSRSAAGGAPITNLT